MIFKKEKMATVPSKKQVDDERRRLNLAHEEARIKLKDLEIEKARIEERVDVLGRVLKTFNEFWGDGE